MNYKHIIWDWNGTLLDDVWLCVEVMNSTLSKRNMPLETLESYQRLFEFPVINYYKKLGFDFSHEPFEVLSTEFIQEYERRRWQCDLRAGALSILTKNVQKGLSQSIVSASSQSLLDGDVNHFEIRHMFSSANGVDNHHAFGKIEVGKRHITELALRPDEILFIGDTVHDYEVARAIDVDCWLIFSGHQDRDRLEACGVKVIDSLSELHA